MIYTATTYHEYEIETAIRASRAAAELDILRTVQEICGYDGLTYDEAEISDFIGGAGQSFVWAIEGPFKATLDLPEPSFKHVEDSYLRAYLEGTGQADESIQRYMVNTTIDDCESYIRADETGIDHGLTPEVLARRIWAADAAQAALGAGKGDHVHVACRMYWAT